MKKSDIAVIGLGVMGSHLAINLAAHGFQVSVYNRHTARVREFLCNLESEFGPNGKYRSFSKNYDLMNLYDYAKLKQNITTAFTLEQLFDQLSSPRRILLMIQAGTAVDETLHTLTPFLQAGDVVTDGGNSYYKDTMRRCMRLSEQGVYFVGCGISGGSEGALFGPSIMAGGDVDGGILMEPLLSAIAAKAHSDQKPCYEWMGKLGAGHFVKMVHNGIEYGEMEALAEIFDLLYRGLKLPYSEIADLCTEWNKGPIESYLLDITTRILQTKDSNDEYLLNPILDVAQQKGTGRWCVSAAMDYNVDINMIAAAVMQRAMSSWHDIRLKASSIYRIQDFRPFCKAENSNDTNQNDKVGLMDKQTILSMLPNALLMIKMLLFAQGFSLIYTASEEEKYQISQEKVASVWRAGCILRCRLLEHIMAAFHYDPQCASLLLSGIYTNELPHYFENLKSVIQLCQDKHIPTPVLSAGLQYYLSISTARLPLFLTQAQRDFFGGHLVERCDAPRGNLFHLNWDQPSGLNRK